MAGDKGLHRFTKTIWRTVQTGAYERATHLRNLYAQISAGPIVKKRYLDIGAGATANSQVFGDGFREICCIDHKLPKSLAGDNSQPKDIRYIIADAHKLPLSGESFDMISMLSVVEHLKQPGIAIQEAFRVLKAGGEFVIQFPNRYFPVELHTGLPNPIFLPRFARKRLLGWLGYGYWLDNVRLPIKKEVDHWVGDAGNCLGYRGVSYPAELVPDGIRRFYRLAKKMGLLNLMPMGYICVYQKIWSSHGDTATC